MSQTLPMINNFVGKNDAGNIENGLKLYFWIGSTMGADRLNLCGNLNDVSKYSVRALAIILNISIFVVAVMHPVQRVQFCFILWSSLVQYYLLATLTILHNDTQRRFLMTINDFDNLYGDLGLDSIRKLEIKNQIKFLSIIFAECTVQVILSVLILAELDIKILISAICVISFRLLQSIELLIFREFLKLVYNRIKVVNNRLRVVNPDPFNTAITEVGMHEYNLNIRRMNSAYKMILNASKLLQNSTKWQLTMMVALDTLPKILGWYLIATLMINQENSLQEEYWWAFLIVVASSEITSSCFPIMVAIVCDQINAEEENLRAILAKRLCSSSLDKKGRDLVRAFMAIVDMKCLSFKLLRVADVGVGLFIQCLNLSLKYVIILLQFGKLAETALQLSKN